MQANRQLTWKHDAGESLNMLPRHGEPSTFYEWVSQKAIKLLAVVPVYAGVIIVLMLTVYQYGIPFVVRGNR